MPWHSPLIDLARSKVRWPEVTPKRLPEDAWFILKPANGEILRDGTLEQRRFVEKALATPDFTLLEGPPASGKTTAIYELLLQNLKQGKQVLLVASTHVAVDNVIEGLIKGEDENEGEKRVLPLRIGKEDRISSDAVAEDRLEALAETWTPKLLKFLKTPDGTYPEGDSAHEMLESALRKKTIIPSSQTSF